MANVLKLKNGTSIPVASDFATGVGEVLIKTDTAELFTKLSDNSVKQIGTSLLNQIDLKSNDSSPARIDFYCEVNNAHRTRLKSAAHSAYSGNVDVTLPTSSGTLLLSNGDASSLTNLTGASAATYGSASNVAQIVVDSNGRITGISDVAINVGDTNQNAFSVIAVSGQSNVEADTSTDTVTFVAGSNMTITTNASGDTVTFASSGGGGGATTLSGLSDTTISGLATNDVLKYNGSAWVNSPGDNDYGLITDSATASFDYGSI